ncbi:stage II sporulation protein P [Paenibacillus aceti]|nr:stage II sporulation protein P [Paenibacillus aceti]
MWKVMVCSILLLGSANVVYASGQAHASKSPKGGAIQIKADQKQSNKQANKQTQKQTKVEYARSTVDRLNVRKEPSLKASVIQMIGKQNTYQVLDKNDKWVKIKLAKSNGWVHNDYVEFVQDGNKTAANAGKSDTKASEDKTKVVEEELVKFESGKDEKPQGVKADEQDKQDQAAAPDQEPADLNAAVASIVDVTNLRVGPGLDFEIVGKAQPGETYPIVETEGEWHKITLQDGNTAYIASWVVETGAVNDAQDPTEQTDAEEVNYENKVFIYSSHNRESWRNVARNTKGSSFDDRDVNISMVGKYLGDVLQEKGVPTVVNHIDIARRLEEQRLSYSKSYEESRRAINSALKKNPSLTYFLDIHRDSDVPKQTTTTVINGESYARVLFVIGTNHSNHAKNKQFADALNELLKQKYPGLSRGVLLKGSKQGNGEYNQSVSPGSLLIEVGGVNNTLQESKLAAEALADVFTEYLSSME